ncbi:hypothetical protein [Spiroplasma turonicum]|uniref:Ribose/galactose ABC transporter substrate-binding protein n=1 Tax=Spiroplasma turonicum TaxID=216946 RepID=A0A0K1P5J7_9MOLU|nr:hypothetical protein [Spiroplasma turonicum]AKU79563.1 ribose/galactose ABC transporter substrate-binding protein [Spiroplasma turonicum]ALX70586.1 ribose/galactose ABC transporter substrate-binding protein [Spiroplasma turonicum]
MKKLVSGLLAITVVSSSALTAVACGNNKSFNEIFLITDAGRVSDKSFNESGKNAGDKFIKEISEVNKDGAYSGIGFNEPPNVSEIPHGYGKAKVAGAKVAILPGFHHSGENLKIASDTLGEDSTEIIIDGEPEGLSNVIGLLYKADMSGFYAGMASIYQTIKDGKQINNKVVLATFGGQSNYYAVELFMVGFLAAIDVYNQIRNEEGNNLLDSIFEETEYKKIEAKMAQSSWPENESDKNWYSGSFMAGDGKTISEALLTLNPNVIMPVAGPQTADLLGVIKQKNAQDSIKVVGVDTNQAEAYSNSYSNYFITSAEKNIVDSTLVAIASSKQYYNNETVLKNIKTYYEENNLSMTLDDGKDVKDLLGTKDIMGKTIWTPGDISKDGNNILKSDDATKIKNAFKVEYLKEASNNYFNNINKYDASKLLDATKEYSDLIIKSINKQK